VTSCNGRRNSFEQSRSLGACSEVAGGRFSDRRQLSYSRVNRPVSRAGFSETNRF